MLSYSRYSHITPIKAWIMYKMNGITRWELIWSSDVWNFFPSKARVYAACQKVLQGAQKHMICAIMTCNILNRKAGSHKLLSYGQHEYRSRLLPFEWDNKQAQIISIWGSKQTQIITTQTRSNTLEHLKSDSCQILKRNMKAKASINSKIKNLKASQIKATW